MRPSTSTQGFQLISQYVIFPMVFLSGVFFPLGNLLAWMGWLVSVNLVSTPWTP